MKLKKILITSGVVVAGAVITTIIVVANAGKGKHHGHEETKPTDPILTTPMPSETIPTETSLPSVEESTTETAIEEYCVVTFNLGYGDDITEEITKGSKVVKPLNPTRESTAEFNYEFVGWFTNLDSDDEFNFENNVDEDITLYAKWSETKNQYTYTFYNVDGSIFDEKKVDFGTQINAPENKPQKESTAEFDYEFIGWYTAATGGEEVKEFSTIKEDIVFFARFKEVKRKYTITYLMDNGEVIESLEVEYGKVPTSPQNVSKEATAEFTYTFAGWDNIVAEVTGDTTYKAVFTSVKNKYTITWLMDDDTVISEVELEYGATPEAPANVAKESTPEYTYQFVGWNNTINNVSGDATYKAVFESTYVEYEIKFVDYDDKEISTANYHYNEMPTAPTNLTRESTAEFDYEFTGWDKKVSNVTGSVIYKAVYKETIRKYNVTYVLNNGENNIVVEYEYGKIINDLEDISNEGKVFAGWYSDIDLTNVFDFNNPVSGETTLYASWATVVTKCNVTFVYNNGLENTDVKVIKGHTVKKPEDPTKEQTVAADYVFAGWYTDAEFKNIYDFSSYVEDTLTLYAKYDEVARKYTITYLMDNGEVIESLEVEYGKVPTSPQNVSKEATAEFTYTFAGWDNIVAEVTGDTTYKAVFTSVKNKYTITWLMDDDTVISEVELEYGATPEAPANVAKESTPEYTYQFVGWNNTINNVSGDATYKAVFDAIKNKYTITWKNYDGTVLDTDLVEYGVLPEFSLANPTRESDAQYSYTFKSWSPEIIAVTGEKEYVAEYNYVLNKYTVTFETNGGTAINPVEVEYGKTVAKPINPQLSGKSFKCWMLNNEEYDFTTPIEGNIILVAEYEAKEEYTVTWLNDDGTLLRADTVDKNAYASYGTKPAKNGYKFAYWTLDGEEFDLNTPITSDITLKAFYAEVIYVGFGNSYTPWKDVVTAAGESVTVDSKSRYVLNTDVELNNFTFVNNNMNLVTSGYASYNTQTSIIKVNLLKESSSVLTCTWASSSSGKITITNESGEVVYQSDTISGNGTNCSFRVDDLPAGEYTITPDKSINISVIYYETLKEYSTVSFVTNTALELDSQKVVTGSKLTDLPELVRDNYKFDGWFTSEDVLFDLNTPITSNITLYAKWTELTEEEKATVSFVVNVNGYTISDIVVEKGKSIIAPELNIDGYRFDNYYSNVEMTKAFDINSVINVDTTIYLKYIKQWTITYQDQDGNTIGTILVDNETPFGEVSSLSAPYVAGYVFEYWTNNGIKFEDSDDIISNITLVAKYKEDDGTTKKLEIVKETGLQESAYVLFNEYNNATGYSVYSIDSNNNTIKLNYKNYYITKTATGYRADLFGLTKGTHKFLIVPEISNEDAISLGAEAIVDVEEYDRSGYAHFNYTEGVGAYKDNGELKENAIVLYVTDDNKNTVELSYGGITVTGIGNILNSAGKDSGNGLTSKGGKANTNQGILRLLAENNIPLVVRFVGCVSNTGLYNRGSFTAANTPKINGLTAYDSVDWGGSVGDNGHMARMQSAKNVTFEGVGSDATIDGWGFHLICESSAPDLAKNFEVRNLKFINTPEDAIGMEGQQEGSLLTASVERCWIHNNEFYCPNISGPAESDKAQGDGSVDFKRGMYFTCSYNYFEGCHKTNLVGSSDSSLQYNLTYHHNYWYMCAARGPLARQANIHMYNNIFYGQTDYAMNTRANSYIYSEYNLFYACKQPHLVKAGAIKSFGDSLSSALDGNATYVSSKEEVVSSNCAYNGVSYSSFELNDKLSYIPTNDYYLQDDVTEAKKVVYARCGTAKAELPVIENMSMSDITYLYNAISNPTINKISVGTKSNPTVVTPGKISKNIYAFEIDKYATATITYAADTDSATGVLLNEAGVCLLKASGTVQLKPGRYFVQCYNFQPGDYEKNSPMIFKDMTINSISFAEYDSTEYMSSLINDFNNAVDQILSPVSYTNACYNAINNAYNKYNLLNSTARSNATVKSNYTKLEEAYDTYKTLGINYVESAINDIVLPVSASNASLVYSAREKYNDLITKINDATVSNYNKLLEAESQLESIAVTVFINKVNEIDTPIQYNDNCYNQIQAAFSAYEALTSAQKQVDEVVAAYQVLVGYNNTYKDLELEASKVTVSFVANVSDVTIPSITVIKNNVITLPNVTKTGYRLVGYYTNSQMTNAFVSSTPITTNTTLYAKYVEQCNVTFVNLDGSTVVKTADKGSPLTDILQASYVSGKKFKYWSLEENGSEFDLGSEDILSNITLYAVYEETSVSQVAVMTYGGDQESLYAEFLQLEDINDYNAYVKLANGSYTKLDKELIRYYSGTPNYYRVDAVGLKGGTYSLKIVPVVNKQEIAESAAEITNITVVAHDRTGFGFKNGSSSGAYNDDGTLKDNATVVYVTADNKNSVKALGSDAGVQNILLAMKSNKVINTPVCIRFIGNITDPSVLTKGDLYVDAVTAGLTLEGIGTDATINGFGIVIKNSSNVEVRNLGLMNCNSEEGDSIGLQQSNDHVWVHNCDIFYGDAGSDADQAKGDGALDTKKSTYITHSYNHFFDTGKSNLQGMKSESTENYITYHHNWYDHSDSRHPRIRTCTVHIYNNYFDGNAKYGVGMTMGGSAFVEANYFRSTATMKPMLISGQGTDALGEGTFSGETGGVIKAYNNTFDGNVSFIPHTQNATSFDAYVATSRNEMVPSSYKALSGGTTYNNFDTDSSKMYSYNVETPEQAKETVMKYAGRVQGGDFKWTFTDADDSDYSVNKNLKSAIVSYKSKLISVLNSDGSSTQPGGEAETSSADTVIAMINALPTPSSVTSSDSTAINAANTAYNKLSETEKAKVTNYSKLQECLSALSQLGGGSSTQTGQVLTFPNSNSYFSVTGSTSTSKGTVTYNSNTYNTCLKIESSTSITFTTTSKTTLTIVLGSSGNNNIKVDGAKVVGDANYVITLTIEAGSHTITKADSAFLFYLSVE